MSLVLVLVGVAASASAEGPARRVFVPVLSAAPDASVDTVRRAFERALGEGAIPNGVAAQQFERARSREPVAGAGEEIASADAAADVAVKQLGSGHLRPGRIALERAERLLEGERGDAYRRQRERVQKLFDACSLYAMLLSRAKRHDEAATQMEHCVLSYPGSAPEGEPEIQPLFDAARERIPHGHLRVEGEAGCVVRANGIELGRVPLEMVVPTGDYRLQLECSDEELGRVRALRVREGETRVTADPLDAGVRTRPGLWLRPHESIDADSLELARLLSANVVLLIGEGDRVRVRADGRDIAVVRPGDDVRPILPLLGTPEADAPVSAPARPGAELAPAPTSALALTESAQAPEVTGRSALEYVAGISLVVVGTGALTVGWILYAQRYSLRSRVYGGDVPYGSRERFADLGAAAVGVSAFGAALLAGAEPLLVSDGGVPGAAWVLAAGGVVLAATGIGFGLAEHCEPQTQRAFGSTCSFVDDALFGPLLALHAVPLVTLPVMYGLRQLIGGESTVVLGFGVGSGHLALRGTF